MMTLIGGDLFSMAYALLELKERKSVSFLLFNKFIAFNIWVIFISLEICINRFVM